MLSEEMHFIRNLIIKSGTISETMEEFYFTISIAGLNRCSTDDDDYDGGAFNISVNQLPQYCQE
jgi:hypothetical protein